MAVTVWTEGDEILIRVVPAFIDKDDMVNININVATSRDGTPMPRFDKNTPTYISGYRGPRTAQILPPEYLVPETGDEGSG